jgi:CTP synthase (UTP-ammonia lyase)
MREPRDPVRIAIIGDFGPSRPSHWATEASLYHAAARLGLRVEPTWIDTPALVTDEGLDRLEAFDGVWAAPGSPYQSMAGMLRGIRYARERRVPFLGTCGGFQYALIELTRNVLGIADADSAENDSGSENIVITPVECVVPPQRDTPRLSGTRTVLPARETLFATLCGDAPLAGEYFCSFETNGAFLPRWLAAGLVVSGRDEKGELRAFELPSHPFFVATLFQPQLASRPERPHALIDGYLRACAGDPGVAPRRARTVS